ncbi:MAG: hypothetical protein PHW77_01700 [Eubacteriales bacterium]|nr:hypothetical protein [Eubacteriales bacterium]
MKRIVYVLLAVVVIFSFTACDKTVETEKTGYEMADEICRNLTGYYAGRKLTDYKEAAALCAAGFDMTSCDWSALVAAPSTGLKSYTEFLISVYFLGKAGCDVSECDTERYLGYLNKYLDDTDSISTTELSKIVIALMLYERDFDMTSVADNLLTRQDAVSGGFYDYPIIGGETATINIEAAAFALMAYQTIRPAVWSAKYNDTINDSTMIYLFYQINEDNSFTVNDYYGKASASATAVCLTSLLSAGMTTEGDNALCLLNGVNTFTLTDAGKFAGYKEYSADQIANADATAYALLCAVTVKYGNPLTEKKADIN